MRLAHPTTVVPETRIVPGGRFAMGSTEGRPDEAPVHDVSVGRFALARHPVTVREYAPFLAAGRVEPPPWWGVRGFDAAEQPVVGVNWFEAEAYSAWLGGLTGERWRLPSEAEWERAARGGLPRGRTAWGDVLPPGEVPGGPLEGPWPAGKGRPNGFDLLDMGTVVHEWCLDWYHPGYYAVSPPSDPRGPEEGERRASRGGSWRHRIRWSSPAGRSSLPPAFRYADYGFRVLREIS